MTKCICDPTCDEIIGCFNRAMERKYSEIEKLTKENKELKNAVELLSKGNFPVKALEHDEKGFYVWSGTNGNKCYLKDWLKMKEG
jgi:hypothetical protein